jgi:hypothetical protein
MPPSSQHPARAAPVDTVVVRPAGAVLRVEQDRPALTGYPASMQGWNSVCLMAARRLMNRAEGVPGRTVVKRRERGTDTESLRITPLIDAFLRL